MALAPKWRAAPDLCHWVLRRAIAAPATPSEAGGLEMVGLPIRAGEEVCYAKQMHRVDDGNGAERSQQGGLPQAESRRDASGSGPLLGHTA